MASTSTTTATKPAPASTTPIGKAYADHVAKKAAYVARRRGPVIPRTIDDMTVVEVKGHAKVDHTENGETTKSDHQGAVGVVVASYPSEARGERMASVKCEDGQMRAIPESRLRVIGSMASAGTVAPTAERSAPASAPASAQPRGRTMIGGGDENYRRNWERLFGSKTKTAAS